MSTADANMVAVKICGVTSVADAVACVEEGADAIGVNFWRGSTRWCDEATARAIADAIQGPTLVVGVFLNAGVAEVERVRRVTGVSWAQLHGDEESAELDALLPRAYKAIRVDGREALDAARRYRGDRILLDAHAPGLAGGSGLTFDWSLAAEVARERCVILAGGLDAGNVGRAIEVVHPAWVDVASGVQSAPGVIDRARVRAFMHAVRVAAARSAP